MIFICRPPAPAFLTAPGNPWQAETLLAIQHYSVAGQQMDFDYQKYNLPELKAALRDVFGGKCAYCESKYASNSDGDIEHFRPKGRVEGKTPDKPGYYWLANDWDNLLLACQHCNQSRKHQIYVAAELQNDKKTKGKLDKFPLTDPLKRITSHTQNLADEEALRLLINPCIDRPEDHFDYDEKKALLKPKTAKAEKSIEVYVLQRQFLVQNRKERLAYLFAAIKSAKDTLDLYNRLHLPELKTLFDNQLDCLLLYTDPGSEYSGMCRYFVKKFLTENNLNP